MSLLYSILKPIVRKAIKGSSLHQEESYEEFKRESYKVQARFRFSLPELRGFEFRDEQLDGFHIIVGRKASSHPSRAIVYFPGGGSRRWQLPSKSSMKNYIARTGAELWIRIVRFDAEGVSSREGNKHVPVWNHDIRLIPLDDKHTEYTDQVEIRAGWKTLFVWLWAKAFYAHRQRKWIKLLAEER